MRDCSAARVLRKRGDSCKRFVVRATPQKRDFFSPSALFITAKNHQSGRYAGKTLLFPNKNRLIKRAAEYYLQAIDKRSGRAVIRDGLWTEGKAAR